MLAFVLYLPLAQAAHGVVGCGPALLSCPGLHPQSAIDVDPTRHDAYAGHAVQFTVEVAEYIPRWRVAP